MKCCIFSKKVLQNTFTYGYYEPDQSAPQGAVLFGSILFAIKVRQMKYQMKTVMNGRKRVNPFNSEETRNMFRGHGSPRVTKFVYSHNQK